MRNMVQCQFNGLVCGGLFSLIFTGQSVAQTPPPSPASFAYRTEIELPNNGGPFYQVALPLQVYQGSQRSDLGDVRIFNGLGETVPYTLIHPSSISSSQEKNVSVSIFPITRSKVIQSDEHNLLLDVQRQPNGTLVAVPKRTNPGKEITVVQGVIIDTSQIKEPVRRLHLETSPSTSPFHAFSVETSDDLQQWRTLLINAQLVHLKQGGQVIDKDSFDLDGSAGKYLRVLWNEPVEAPSVVSASVVTTHTATNNVQVLWTDPIQASTVEDNVYDYPIAGHQPIERVRIDLQQINTLAPLQIQRYRKPDAQSQHGIWETLVRTVVYRLQSPQGEMRSPDLMLNALPAERLRLLIDGSSGGIGKVAPMLQVGVSSQNLVFLARGQGPFSLAWGSKDVAGASMSPENLLPNYSSDRVLVASQATLKPIASIQLDVTSSENESTSVKTSKGLLWSALGGGLLVLAGMVLMLIRQMRQGSSDQS